MRKTLTKMLAVVLTFFCVGCAFAGCNKNDDKGGVNLDPNKETILIQVYGGGFGSDWLVDMLNKYNATLTGNYQFGKIADTTDGIVAITTQINAGVSKADIYMNDTCEFTALMRQGKLLDLTDVWQATPDEAAPERKISDKFYNKDILETAWSYNGKNYGIPYTMGVSGIIYDHDFFNQAKFFIYDDESAGTLSAGRDGKRGTYDDGLPATEAEFKQMLDKITASNSWPYVLYDINTGATQYIMEAVWAEYEGLESYNTSYSYNGNMYYPSTGITKAVTPETGYLVYSESEGRAKAMEFLKKYVLFDGYTNEKNYGINHVESESTFLFSHADSKRIAMTVNGCWWENEARTAFETDARRNGQRWAYGNRDFRFMPVPAIDGQNASSNDKAFMSVSAFGSVFATDSDNEERNQAIKDFLTFFASDAGNTMFTESVGIMPAYDFELNADVLDTLTPFCKNYYEMLHSGTVELVCMAAMEFLSPINYMTTQAPDRWELTASNGKLYNSPYRGFRDGFSLDTYSAELKSVWDASKWNTAFAEVGGWL